MSTQAPASIAELPLRRNNVGLIGIKKLPPELLWQCQAILLQFVLLVILSHQKLERKTTINGEAAGNKVRQPHRPSQLLLRKLCTLTEVAPSKSFGPSETLYRSRSYHTPRRFQCHA